MVTTQKMVTRVCVSYPKHGFLSIVNMMALFLLVYIYSNRAHFLHLDKKLVLQNFAIYRVS